MKHIVWRPYWDYQKEEQWLNSMMAKGYALSDYSWCRYVFEEAPVGAYVYKLDLLERAPSAPESLAYLRFLEESGVQVVATYMKWVYLRQPAHLGEFNLYTDRKSLLSHYKTIMRFWGIMIILEIGIGLINLFMGLMSVMMFGETIGIVNLTIGALPLLIGLLLLKMVITIFLKVRDLKREIDIME